MTSLGGLPVVDHDHGDDFKHSHEAVGLRKELVDQADEGDSFFADQYTGSIHGAFP